MKLFFSLQKNDNRFCIYEDEVKQNKRVGNLSFEDIDKFIKDLSSNKDLSNQKEIEYLKQKLLEKKSNFTLEINIKRDELERYLNTYSQKEKEEDRTSKIVENSQHKNTDATNKTQSIQEEQKKDDTNNHQIETPNNHNIELNKLNEGINQLNSKMDDLKGQISSVLKKLEEINIKDNEIKDKDNEIKDKDDKIKKLTSDINDKNNQIEKLISEINIKDNEIKDKDNEIKDKDDKIKKLTSDINDKNNQIEKLISEINIKDNEIKDKDNEIKDKDDKIKKLTSDINDKNNQIEKLISEINIKDNEIKDKDNEIKKLTSGINRLKLDKNNCVKQYNELHEKYKSLKEIIFSEIKNEIVIYKKLLSLKDKYKEYVEIETMNIETEDIEEAIKIKDKIKNLQFNTIILKLANEIKNKDDLNEIDNELKPEYSLIIPKIGDRLDSSIHNPVKFTRKEGEKRGIILNSTYIGLKKGDKVIKLADVEVTQ
ncbi:MAG: hypothetical protein KatS3mg068_1358 [Candidatus Sericytochromatia bacterium]|nr:MAG: hypothetical protein KatS3mg068_1358 [Candidatus Sericytochromatia bacterium]